MLPHSRILVADDDPQLLQTLVEGLSRLGADVTCAENGAELIEQLANEGPFDLVITDITMPWMDGVEAIHSAQSVGLGTPVIIMTALQIDDIPADVRALDPQHTALVRKPFTLSQLESVVTTLLKR